MQQIIVNKSQPYGLTTGSADGLGNPSRAFRFRSFVFAIIQLSAVFL